MLLTTEIGESLETSPYAAMLQWAPAVGSEPPTRHGPKPGHSPTNVQIDPSPTAWEEMIERINPITRLKRRQCTSRRTPDFARLEYETAKVEHHETDGTKRDELSEFDPDFDASNVSKVGIDEFDAAGTWLATSKQKEVKRAAA